jgi:hypothetical protein
MSPHTLGAACASCLSLSFAPNNPTYSSKQTRSAQRLVDAAEVIEHKPYSHGRRVVLDLLAEGVRERSETANTDPHAWILAFHLPRNIPISNQRNLEYKVAKGHG